MVLDEGGAGASGAVLEAHGQEVGIVTQAVVSPHLEGATLGLAKIRKDMATPGTQVTARLAGGPVPGRVVPHPTYDPELMRAKLG